MRIPPQLTGELQVRIRTDGTLTVWSPVWMKDVALEPVEVTVLAALGGGALPRDAMRRAGLAPHDDEEVDAYFARYVVLGLLEDPGTERSPILLRAFGRVLGVAVNTVTAARAAVHAMRRSPVHIERSTGAPLDLAWDAGPAWRESGAPRTVVRRPEQGVPTRETNAVGVSMIAYPLS